MPKTAKKAAKAFSIQAYPEYVELINKLRLLFPEGTKFTSQSVKAFYNDMQNLRKDFEEHDFEELLHTFCDTAVSLTTTNGQEIVFDLYPMAEDITAMPGQCGVLILHDLDLTPDPLSSGIGAIICINWLLKRADVQNVFALTDITPFTDMVAALTTAGEGIVETTSLDNYFVNGNTGNTVSMLLIKTVAVNKEEEEQDLAEEEVDPGV